jgi:hypothetical protein
MDLWNISDHDIDYTLNVTEIASAIVAGSEAPKAFQIDRCSLLCNASSSARGLRQLCKKVIGTSWASDIAEGEPNAQAVRA